MRCSDPSTRHHIPVVLVQRSDNSFLMLSAPRAVWAEEICFCLVNEMLSTQSGGVFARGDENFKNNNFDQETSRSSFMQEGNFIQEESKTSFRRLHRAGMGIF